MSEIRRGLEPRGASGVPGAPGHSPRANMASTGGQTRPPVTNEARSSSLESETWREEEQLTLSDIYLLGFCSQKEEEWIVAVRVIAGLDSSPLLVLLCWNHDNVSTGTAVNS